MPEYYVKGSSERSMSQYIDVNGGSGSYTFEAAGDTMGLNVDSDGYVWGYAKMAGTYTVPVKVTDEKNPALTTTVNVVFNVMAGRTITGTVTDNTGAAVPYPNIAFVSKDQSNKYGYYFTPDTTNEKGYYEITVPDGVYTVTVSNNYNYRYFYDETTGKYYDLDTFDYVTGDYNKGETHILNYTVSADAMGQNFTLPYTMTKVESADQNSYDYDEDWE